MALSLRYLNGVSALATAHASLRDRELASVTLAEANHKGARRLLLQQKIRVLLVDETIDNPATRKTLQPRM
jgi:hypothetical protein